jgi:hypothetical protein
MKKKNRSKKFRDPVPLSIVIKKENFVSKQNPFRNKPDIKFFFFLNLSPLAGVQAHLRRGGGLRLLRHDGYRGCRTLC